MYIDIEPNANVDEAAMATFKETGAGRVVRAALIDVDGTTRWCAVVGWDGERPCDAKLTPIEESGDGPARLMHGGAQGLRFARIAGAEPATEAGRVIWDLGDPAQWGEAFRICRPEAVVVFS
jgi:hypothetical protein